jgi:two-component system chemotaxis response regulator CheB
MSPKKPVRVLVVDDSPLTRSILAQGLGMDPAIEVVGTAGDAFEARDRIVQLKPEVMTLDLEMPRMSGLEFLRRLMPQYPIPVVMVSSLTERGQKTTVECLGAGAVDFVAKSGSSAGELNGMLAELRTKVKIASTANVSHWKHARFSGAGGARLAGRGASFPGRIVAIGASTGGTEAIREVLERLPGNVPGILVVQHMPPGFTAMFAERMNQLCAMAVKEAEDGDAVAPGRVLIGAGGKHLRLKKRGADYYVEVRPGELVNGHCPSVGELFDSVAETAGANAVGVMLTGMGADGADAMVRLRRTGARTLAQNEETSVVFGMPREAYVRGGAERLVPLGDIAGEVLNLLAKKATT